MNGSGLDLPLLLIFLVAPLGAFDVIYFHVLKFRLAQRPASWAETQTHVVRSFLLGAVVLLLALAEPRGLWFWVVAGLFGLDFVNSVLDALTEDASRAELGGLPRGEYVIHIIGSTAMGAIAVAFLHGGFHLSELDTALVARPTPLSGLMAANAMAVAIGSLVLGGYEAVTMMLSKRRQVAVRRA